jgi:hypothetical protein
MTKAKAAPSREWSGSYEYQLMRRVSEGAGPGDTVRLPARRSGHAWRALRLRLAARGLELASVGKTVFVVPLASLPLLGEFRALALDARKDKAVRRVLHDFVIDFFGERDGLPEYLVGLLARARTTGHAAVPGGELPEGRGQPRRIAPAAVSMPVVHELRRRVARLGKTQRVVLQFAADYDMRDFEGAPLHLLRAPTRAGAAALSRAVRQLEARELVHVDRSVKGRARAVRLTRAGRQALGIGYQQEP